MLRNYIYDLRNCRDDESRTESARRLRNHVETEARVMFGDRFVTYMNDLNEQILELVNSTSTSEKLGGIAAIDELISVETEENATKITRCAERTPASAANMLHPAFHMAIPWHPPDENDRGLPESLRFAKNLQESLPHTDGAVMEKVAGALGYVLDTAARAPASLAIPIAAR